MNRILVTGGAGFIGTNLCRELVERGHHVICFDNFSTGSQQNVRSIARGTFEVVAGDVQEPFFFDVDQIYHLACPASPPHYQNDPVRTCKTNILGAINVLECAAHANARVLLASTSEIYGNPSVSPQPETYYGNVNSYGPRSCYDEGKRMSETLFYDYRRSQNIDTAIVRIFNTYGPYMSADDGRIISELIVRGLRGEALDVFGDGTQTRSFCFVDDLVKGLILMMESSAEGPINFGNPRELSLNELFSISREVLPFDVRVEYGEFRKDDPMTRRPDIQLAKDTVGWEPSVPLEEGLLRTYSYFANQEKKNT